MLSGQRHGTGLYARRSAFFRPHVLLLGVLTVGLIVFWPSTPSPSNKTVTMKPSIKEAATTDKQQEKPTEKVMVELFAMSRCPDAKFCEQAFLPIIKKVPSVATVRTEYIASLADNDSKVSCMHGDSECMGNKQQLCLQAYTPADKNVDWFYNTLMCHMGGDVADIKQLKSCMTVSSITEDVQGKVLKCIEGEEGTQLQVKSAKEVKVREVKKSCTVYIDGKRRCIRDGGRWYDCPEGDSEEAFLKSICAAHQNKTGSVVPECAAAVPAVQLAAPAAEAKTAGER